MEAACHQPFMWAVVGAGPCGIIAVALLVEHISQKERDAACKGEAEYWKACKIAWVDPDFRVGNLPRWQEVQANSSVQAICSSLAAVPSLAFCIAQQSRTRKGQRTLSSLLPESNGDCITRKKVFCELGLVVDALGDAMLHLLKNDRVIGIRGQVTRLVQGDDKGQKQRHWSVECAAVDPAKHHMEAHDELDHERQRGILASLRNQETVPDDIEGTSFSALSLSLAPAPVPLLACTVVLATGAMPKAPPPSLRARLHVVDLETAVIGARLRALVRWTPPPCALDGSNHSSWLEMRWTVVGSSHSAMLAVRNLIGLGVHKVQVVHRRPLLYVESRCMPSGVGTSTWLKNVGNGLVGTTGSWSRKELPLLEKSGRVVWKCFPDDSSTQRGTCNDKSTTENEWETWVLNNSDVLVFAAGFKPVALPIISLTEHQGPSSEHKPASSQVVGKSEPVCCSSSRTDAVDKSSTRSRSRSPKFPDQKLTLADHSLLFSQNGGPKLPGLVGLGIGFPELYVEPDGDVDVRVGFGRYYMEHAVRTLGLSTDILQFDDDTKML